MTMTKEDRLQNIIDNTHDGFVLGWWNDMCDNTYDDERHIYCMEEFNECFYGLSPLKIAEVIENADRFSSCDEYFVDGIYGLNSFDDLYDIMDDAELIDYMIDNDEDFGDDRIREVLDSDDEDEEDEEDEDDIL